MGPGDLSQILSNLRLYRPDNLLVGFETGDDAGVYDIGASGYLVQTVDFITPVVDDAYTFGRIAAVNSMSDVYAMGGTPITALSVFAYNCGIGKEMIKDMMQGACDEFRDNNCALCGGHTVDDHEIKLGFSITGTITDRKIYKNCGLRTGDVLIYTKKLGIGLITTAIKAGMATEEHTKEVIKTMLLTNRAASGILRKYDVSACTDVTGFGLAGHGFEMANGSDKTIEIFSENLTIQNGAEEYAKNFIIPAGAYSNMEFVIDKCMFKSAQDNKHMVFFDPQTAGGLLIGVKESQAEAMVSELKSIGYENAAVIGITSEKTDMSVIIN